jgi:hypothetical protein
VCKAYTHTHSDFTFSSEPCGPETPNVTVYKPGLVYAKLGCWAVESTVPSLSKSQDHPSISPVDESAKVTDSGALPVVGLAEKSAKGGAAAVTDSDPGIATIKNNEIKQNFCIPLPSFCLRVL